MEIVWGILILSAFFTILSLAKWLIDMAWERKGKWLKVVEVISALCMILVAFAGLYVLWVGVAKLWDESWPAGLMSAGALAFVVYFYVTRDGARRKIELTPKLADEIIEQYGAALETGLSGGATAIPESSLPCSKEKVKKAFKMILAFQIDNYSLREEDRSHLVAGLMYLGYFVPDAQADLINQGTCTLGDPAFDEFVDYKTETAIAIKDEMDKFVTEVNAFEEFDPLFHQRVCTLIGLEYSNAVKKAFTEYANELRR